MVIGEIAIRPDSKIAAEAFAVFFDKVVGISTKTYDITNERKKSVFTPGMVPNTTEAREKLVLIKETLFPKLQIEDLLSEDDGLLLVMNDE